MDIAQIGTLHKNMLHCQWPVHNKTTLWLFLPTITDHHWPIISSGKLAHQTRKLKQHSTMQMRWSWWQQQWKPTRNSWKQSFTNQG